MGLTFKKSAGGREEQENEEKEKEEKEEEAKISKRKKKEQVKQGPQSQVSGGSLDRPGLLSEDVPFDLRPE